MLTFKTRFPLMSKLVQLNSVEHTSMGLELYNLDFKGIIGSFHKKTNELKDLTFKWFNIIWKVKMSAINRPSNNSLKDESKTTHSFTLSIKSILFFVVHTVISKQTQD